VSGQEAVGCCKPHGQLELLHHGVNIRVPQTHDCRSPNSNLTYKKKLSSQHQCSQLERSMRGGSPHPPPQTWTLHILIRNNHPTVYGDLASVTLDTARRILATKATLRASHTTSHCQDHHHTMCTSPILSTPMAPLHLPANTNLTHLFYRCARANLPIDQHYHYHKLRRSHVATPPRKTWCQRRHHHTWSLCYKSMVPRNGALSMETTLQERRHHHHRHFTEGFHRTTPCSPHVPDMLVAHFMSLSQHLWQKGPT
jgi:hypothetical protein